MVKRVGNKSYIVFLSKRSLSDDGCLNVVGKDTRRAASEGVASRRKSEITEVTKH